MAKQPRPIALSNPTLVTMIRCTRKAIVIGKLKGDHTHALEVYLARIEEEATARHITIHPPELQE